MGCRLLVGGTQRNKSNFRELKRKAMNLFEEMTKGLNLENPDFKNLNKCHDWRNYVPYDWQRNWNEITERERKIIAVMAEMQAEDEEWD